MLPSVEVQFDLKIGDLYWLLFSSAIQKLIYARWVLAIALIFLVAIGTKYIAFAGFLVLPPVLFLLLVGAILVAVVLPYIRSRSFVRATMGESTILSCTIGPQGVDLRRQSSAAHYNWEAVRSAKQTSSLVLIYVDRHGLVIPKRCFASSQQLNDFRSIVAAHVKVKAKPRDYWP